MKRIIWVVLKDKKIVAMWNKDYIQDLKAWRKAVLFLYPDGKIKHINIKL